MPTPQGVTVMSQLLPSAAPAVVFLFVVVFLRAQGTYWLGRGFAAGVIRTSGKSGVSARVAGWLEGPHGRRAARMLDRWGVIAVPASMLTVGLQTAVLASAGVARMSWRRFTLALVPGAVAWAMLYGVGFTAIWAALRSIAGEPATLAAAAGAAASLAVALVFWRRRARYSPATRSTAPPKRRSCRANSRMLPHRSSRPKSGQSLSTKSSSA